MIMLVNIIAILSMGNSSFFFFLGGGGGVCVYSKLINCIEDLYENIYNNDFRGCRG